MADAYNVSVKLSMEDQVSKKLSAIRTEFGKVIGAAEVWNTKMTKLAETFGILSANVYNTQNRMGQLALPSIKAPTVTGGGVKSSSPSVVPDVQKTTQEVQTLRNVLSGIIAEHKRLTSSINLVKSGYNLLSETHNAIMVELKQLGVGFKDWVGQRVDSTTGKLGNLAKKIPGVTTGMRALNTVHRGFNATADFTKELLKVMGDRFKEVGTTIHGWVSSAFNRLKSDVSTLSTYIGNRLTGSLQNGITKLETFRQKLINVSGASKTTSSSVDALTSKVKGLAGAYLGMQGLNNVIDVSDSITLTQGKLSQLTDDVEGFMDKAYQMSQETRTSYLDNASQMAKMWQLTDGTDGIFETEDKLMRFNELLNKSFVLGGSGPREINASMYQLTQALSSGRLQGDELRSLGENASYFVNVLRNYIEESYNAGKPLEDQIELTYNDLKKLGAEGVLTSDMIVNAFLQSGEAIDEAYKNVNVTFGQLFQTLKNQLQKIAQPLLNKLNEVANSEAFNKMIQSIVQIFTVVMAFIDPILNAVLWLGEVISNNWSKIEPVIWGIVGALAVYLGYLVLSKTWNLLLAGAIAVLKGIIVVTTAVMGAVKIATALFTGSLTAATFASAGLAGSLTFIIGIIAAVVLVVYLVVKAVLSATDSTASAIGVTVGIFSSFFAYLYNNFTVMWNFIVSIIEAFVNIWTNPVYTIKKLIANLCQAIIDMVLAIVSPIDSIVTGVVNTIISGVNHVLSFVNDVVNSFAWALDKIPGLDVGRAELGIEYKSSSISQDLQGLSSALDDWVGEEPENYKSLDSWRLDPIDLGDAYDWGYGKGTALENKVGELVDMVKDGGFLDYTGSEYDVETFNPAEEYLDSLTDPSGGKGNYADEGLPQDVIDAINGNTGKIAENTEMAKDDLKYLREIAERKVINRFTTAEIKVTTNMNNNINGEQDLDGIADYFQKVLEKAVNSTAEKTNGRAVI